MGDCLPLLVRLCAIHNLEPHTDWVAQPGFRLVPGSVQETASTQSSDLCAPSQVTVGQQLYNTMGVQWLSGCSATPVTSRGGVVGDCFQVEGETMFHDLLWPLITPQLCFMICYGH
jgi:hypothetical protein